MEGDSLTPLQIYATRDKRVERANGFIIDMLREVIVERLLIDMSDVVTERRVKSREERKAYACFLLALMNLPGTDSDHHFLRNYHGESEFFTARWIC